MNPDWTVYEEQRNYEDDEDDLEAATEESATLGVEGEPFGGESETLSYVYKTVGKASSAGKVLVINPNKQKWGTPRKKVETTPETTTFYMPSEFKNAEISYDTSIYGGVSSSESLVERTTPEFDIYPEFISGDHVETLGVHSLSYTDDSAGIRKYSLSPGSSVTSGSEGADWYTYSSK